MFSNPSFIKLAGGTKVEAPLLSQSSSQHYPFKKENVLPVPISDYSSAAQQNKAAAQEIQNISTTSSLHVILLPTIPSFYQADTDVSEISE